MSLERLATRLYNVPLMLMPEKAEVIEHVIANLMATGHLDMPKGESAIEAEEREAREYAALMIPARRTQNGYSLTDQGVAVVSMHGSLIQRAGMFDSFSGATSYQAVMQKLDAALRDPLVKGVVMDNDSPGGEVAGVFELADFIAEAHKPVFAVANELAASAAYLVSSAADRVFVAEAGQVGSIGVLMLHRDRSALVEKSGVRYTPIYAGAKKVDGSSLSPLSEGARSDLQRRVDELYGLMTESVAHYRGISAEAVRATEAGMLSATEAIDQGFATDVGTLLGAIQAMQTKVNAFGYSFTPRAPRASTVEVDMSEKDKAAPAATSATQEQLATERAVGYAAAEKDLVPKAKADGAQAERDRVAAILSCDEAKGRDAMARHLALKTAHSVDDAKALLAVAAKEVSAPANPLASSMPPNPKVGADGEPRSSAENTKIETSAELFARRRAEVIALRTR